MNIFSKGILLLFIIVLFVPNYNSQTLDAVTRFGKCNEEYVRQFSMNEVAEINCNGTILESITDITGVRFLQENNTIILPFLQTYARKSLLRIATSSLRTIYVVDAFRSVSLAFLRIQQRRNGICDGDVKFFDKPGSFGFDSGLGLQIKTDVLLNQYFVDEGWIVEQNGNVTNVIYNVVGLVKDVRYLAIRLFQRHWNIDKDMSTIEETGIMDRETIKSMSLYNISGYQHTCPKDYWIEEPNKNVRFMLVVLVPMFFVLTVFVLWFAAVHVAKNDSATPLTSKKRFHLDPQLAQTAPTVQEVEFKPVSTLPKKEVKEEESKQESSVDSEIHKKKKKKSRKEESSSVYSSTLEGEYEEGEYEDQYEYEFFSEDEDEDEEQYEWEDLGDEEGGYEFFGEDENENEDENEYTYEEEDEYEEGEDEDENETDYTSDRD